MDLNDLQREAMRLLLSDLTRYGNEVSEDHAKALGALVDDMTSMAAGTLKGRWCHGIPTGCGKTAAIIAWITALHAQGESCSGVSVSVSASKVEALCEMKRELLSRGVPASQIGLVHSYRHEPAKAALGTPGFASEPSEGHDRRIVLVTHSRCRSASLAFNQYRGKPRSLCLYDESLLVSAPTGLPLSLTRAALSWCLEFFRDRESHKDFLRYLNQCRTFIDQERKGLKRSKKDFRIVTVPPTDKAGEWGSLLPDKEVVEPVRDLLELAGRSARLTLSGGGGVLAYEISVPPELANVIITDASWPIRQLERSDPTINDAVKRYPFLAESIGRIKSFEGVQLHLMEKPGGREAMTKAFGRDDVLVHEVARVVSRVPKDESVLVVTYKQRGSKGVNFAKEVCDQLVALGINTDEQVSAGDQTRPRINFTTWGNECGSNAYNHCRHVLLVGILHRSHTDLLASLVGQADDLRLSVGSDRLREVERSELVHLAYQALSRGTCRMVTNGKASPMVGWIIERDTGIKAELSKVMPGVTWEPWECDDDKPSIINDAAGLIAMHIQQLNTDKLSTRALKEMANLTSQNFSPRTFTVALHKALNRCPGWALNGRSVVRAFPHHATAS